MKRLLLPSIALLAACSSSSTAPGGAATDAGTDAPATPTLQTLRADVTAIDTRFVTRDHFIASFEMQLSGEPLAETMGRVLTGYSRDFLPTDLYFDPKLKPGTPRQDPTGFSVAVESYEYSKQPMNNVAFESGAGASLAFGPVLNPMGVVGPDALALLRAQVQHLAAASNATARFVSATATASNPLGWPGMWPTLHPYASFDPTIAPTNDVKLACSISSDDDPGATGSLLSDDYECDYNGLHLPNRDAQLEKAITPGASGWSGWKYGLWTQNYLQVMHDPNEVGIQTVPAGQLANAGAPGNTIVGAASVAGVTTAPGTFLGSSDIEGLQAGMFLSMLDNQAADWLFHLTTTDGKTLGGFASLNDALAYSSASPLRWFPGNTSVTEAADASGFPRASYAIGSADSHLLDLAGLLGAYATIYSLTDTGNAGVGGSQPAMAYFDGDPFPADDQKADGESTLHDRALAMMRVLVVNMDRLHFDATTNRPVDDVSFAGATPTRGATLSTDVAAYALLSLRTARRTLTSQLALYTNTKPDTLGIPTPLDALPLVSGATFGGRLDALIDATAALFFDRLSDATGVAYAGWDASKGAVVGDGQDLDGQTAAMRGLFLAYLSTGDAKYRDRANLVFQRLESAFYDPSARVYRARAGDRSATMSFTPRRFALLQAALRDEYELVGVLPGKDALRALLEDRIGRLNKLVLNGWDDRDMDGNLAWPLECARSAAGLPRGGLQMAERTLSGETGSAADNLSTARVITTDREHDCVPEISAAKLPAALANSITFTFSPIKP